MTVAFPSAAEIQPGRSVVKLLPVAIAYFTNCSGSNTTTKNLGDLRADITVCTTPEETLTDLEVATKSDLLAVAGWDKRVRIHDISQTGGQIWHGDKHVSGGTYNVTSLWDVAAAQPTQVVAHDHPTLSILKFNQPRGNAQPLAYMMHDSRDILVAGTAKKDLQVINMESPETCSESSPRALKWRPLMVTCLPDAFGREVRSSWLDFWFPCLRTARSKGTGADVNGQNAIALHPAHGTVPTDGTNEKDACSKTKRFHPVRGIISFTGIKGKGTIFARTVSYNSREGRQYNTLT
ncbi:hypothetical protein HOY80DRAFT_1110070 [Tuber brumale]|nr:hypothetical protein HOY80DRAFT_1110070 [Tuber brumale]